MLEPPALVGACWNERSCSAPRWHRQVRRTAPVSRLRCTVLLGPAGDVERRVQSADAPALRRDRDRRRPQRARERRLSRTGGAEDGGPGKATCTRWRGRDRGGLPGVPLLGLLVRRVAA